MNNSKNLPLTKTYKRVLGLKDLVFLGLSMTIGSGIFVLIGNASKYTGSWTWLAMIVAGILSLTTALSYGELSGLLQSNTAEYGFIKTVTNEKIANISGFVILISDLLVLSTIALGLGQYLSQIIPLSSTFLAISSVILINLFNYYGIETSAKISRGALVAKVIALVALIGKSLTTVTPINSPIGSSLVITQGSFFTGCMLNLFAYLGFNNLINFNEEAKNPGPDIGRSIIITLVIVTVLYTILSVATVRTLGVKQLSHSNLPLADMSQKLFGQFGYIFFMGLAIISLFDTLLVTSVSESRYIHSLLSRYSTQFGRMDMNLTHRTPYLSILSMVIITIMIIYGIKNIEHTGLYGDAIIMILFIVVNLIAIQLRYTQPDAPRPFRIPFNWGQFPIPAGISILIGIYSLYKCSMHCI